MARFLYLLTALSLTAGCGRADGSAAEARDLAGAESAQDADARMALAMSAAPPEVAAEATLMDRDESGELVPLREGTNGWLCVTDENPMAPGEYPVCLDGAWQAWFAAYSAGEAPRIDGVGISYMLQGGPAASNTDPMASGPPQGADWLLDPPHIMIIVPDPAMLAAFPTEHEPGRPYVMWSGTPYAHLMVPTTTH
ncbi:MAG TPA: hypothetical protein VLA43_10765 [Longimicrobiales bacterium]|nr:hypothetical protein [Longimicrobiales bacterium]